MSFWWRDVIAEGTYEGHHTMAVQRGLNLGVGLFIVSEALFFLAIFWTFFHNKSTLWFGIKLRGSPKALITKYVKKILRMAPLTIGGMVTSLRIKVTAMGNRGSKPDSLISVKEQRVYVSSVFIKIRKMYSRYQGNLVLIHPLKNVNAIFKHIQKMCIKYFYSKFQKSLYYSLYGIVQQQGKIPQEAKATLTESSPLSPNVLNPYYVTGFTDGEGCFFIDISPNSEYKIGYRVKATFNIGLHLRDVSLLEQIKLFFECGKISRMGTEGIQFRVSALEDLKVIIDHFDKYPLLTNKQSDFLLFKQVVKLIEKKEHLTTQGLRKIVYIKAALNNKIMPDRLGIAFPNIEPALRPEIKDRKIKSLHWLAGFTDAEGCFFIALKKSSESKLGETVWLKFILTQHTRDEDLLKSLISTLNCGRYIPKIGYGEFVVEKFTDVNDKIIPIFEEFKLQGVKSKNYADFKRAALLIKNKAHLTREGIDNIKKIKGTMNKNRVY